MRGQSETEHEKFRGWTLRVRRSLLPSARLLFLIHGLTGDENSMWVFARNLPESYWIVAPRARHPARTSGYSWQPLQSDSLEPPSLEDMRPATRSLLALVDAYASEHKLDAHSFDIMGFSQGAALACTLAMLHPQRIQRVGVLAGFVPKGAEALKTGYPLAGKSFFVARGTVDKMIDLEQSRQSVRLLEEAGANITLCEDEVGHKVSAGCLRGLEAFFG